MPRKALRSSFAARLKAIDGPARAIDAGAELFRDIEARVRSRSAIDAAIAVAAQNVRPLVVQLLLDELRGSEVKSDTGTLRNAVAGSTFSVSMSDRGFTFKTAFSSAAADYKNTSVHRVAASHQYGSVRAPRESQTIVDLPTGFASRRVASVIGARAKRTLKAGLEAGKLSKAGVASLARGQWKRSSHGMVQTKPPVVLSPESIAETATGMSIDSDKGRIAYIKPKPFYGINRPSARMRVLAAFVRELRTILFGG